VASAKRIDQRFFMEISMRSRQAKLLLVTAGFVLLSACGGGENGSADGDLSGNVIDGYVGGAIVCIDSNANGKCDGNEPQTVTDASGAYKLNTKGLSTAGLNIVADIPDTAKDSDDDGKTLAQAGKSAYTMVSSVDRAAFITPFTTLVTSKVQSEKLSFTEAKRQVMVSLGLPVETNIQEDYLKAGNGVVSSIARQIGRQLQIAQSAQASNSDDRLKAINDFFNTKRNGFGTVVSSGTALSKVAATISSVADSSLLLYKIPSAKSGDLITASTMVFTPKGVSPPARGWPMVVFAHGTSGVSSKCAPSTIMQAGGGYVYEALVEVLIKIGFVVVAPDYEGRGPDIADGHPYLHLSSAGYSMALAAVAAKTALGTKLAGTWAMMGHSQGGHAALAGAQYSGLASQIDSALRYKGAVAIAPASNLSLALSSMLDVISKTTDPSQFSMAYAALETLNLYSSYITKGSDATIEPLPVDTVFGQRLKDLHKASAGECGATYQTAIRKDVAAYSLTPQATPAKYPGVIADEFNKPYVQRMLGALEPGTVYLPGNTLIVQGEADTIVLPATTAKLTQLMKTNNSEVTLKTYVGAGHTTVFTVPQAQADMIAHLVTIFTR
jgi:alpha-beta hydrolase superfamily lysophospholipase